ncbi:hypothetical protein V8C26DRAFT_405098 [Trichoderma gracile]
MLLIELHFGFACAFLSVSVAVLLTRFYWCCLAPRLTRSRTPWRRSNHMPLTRRYQDGSMYILQLVYLHMLSTYHPLRAKSSKGTRYM